MQIFCVEFEIELNGKAIVLACLILKLISLDDINVMFNYFSCVLSVDINLFRV